MMKKISVLLAVCFILCVAGTAFAGTSLSGTLPGGNQGDMSKLTEIPNFLFYHFQDGIECGVCPVYSAPSMDAFRALNGKAACDTNEDLYVGGFEENGWLMVRYETNNDATRTGYIPPQYLNGFSYWRKTTFSYVPAVTDGTVYVTDNPMDHYTAFAMLDSGENYYILGEYTYHGNWWYIECTVDGQVARGFIAK